MSNELRPPIHDIPATEARVLSNLERGDSRAQITALLANEGWNEEDAAALVNRIDDSRPLPSDEAILQAKREESRRRAGHNMTVGACWFVICGLITSITYQAAIASGGGRYVVAWGGIVYGAMRFSIGLNAYRKNSKPLREGSNA